MFSKKPLFALLPFLLLLSCKDDEIEFPVEPAISINSISPANATEYVDEVTISIHYEDGDGDLGENVDGVKNCFVTDNRIGITYEYRIEQLAPSNSKIPIKGNINLNIQGQAITDGSNSQTANYTVYVTDRAGHKSNTANTGNITIHK